MFTLRRPLEWMFEIVRPSCIGVVETTDRKDPQNMKRSLLAIALAAGLLCLAGTPAWASPSTSPDVGWTYNFTPAQSFVPSDSGSGSVSFTNEPTKSATNSSDIVVTNLKVSSTAPSSSPDSFTSSGGHWSVGLQLTDTASGASTTMTFTGQLGGTFSATNANVTNTFTGQTSYTWTAPNGDTYKVSLVGYTPPGPPTASNAGSIAAYVQVTPAGGDNGGGGSPSSTPEPSTLVLSCLGLGFAGLASWRKRRRSLATMLV